MAQYDLILPSGEVILVDRSTGRRLRLSAESGPLLLGSVTLSLDFAPAPLAGDAAADAPEATSEAACGAATEPAAEAPEVPAAPPAEPEDEALAAFARMRSLPPGFAADPAEEAFGSPAPARRVDDGLPPLRTLEAPLEALTREEFERSLESLIAQRDDVAREAEFLEEIGAEPEDVAELRARGEALDRRFAAVSGRFTAWERLQRRLDEE